MGEQPEQPEDRNERFVGDIDELTLVSPQAGTPTEETKGGCRWAGMEREMNPAVQDDGQLSRLVKIGFEPVGEWALAGGAISIRCTKHEKAVNVLYAFVVDDKPVYIGKTVRQLCQRMQQYRTPGDSQRTNVRNRQFIIRELERGSRVILYVLPDNGLMHYGGFHINLAAGLEDSLIVQLKPIWNGGQKELGAATEKVR